MSSEHKYMRNCKQICINNLKESIIAKDEGLTVFTKSMCHFSLKVRRKLYELKIPYVCYDIDLASCEQINEELEDFYHEIYPNLRFTVPQIFWGSLKNHFKGGCDKLLHNLIKNKDKLEETFNISLDNIEKNKNASN